MCNKTLLFKKKKIEELFVPRRVVVTRFNQTAIKNIRYNTFYYNRLGGRIGRKRPWRLLYNYSNYTDMDLSIHINKTVFVVHTNWPRYDLTHLESYLQM